MTIKTYTALGAKNQFGRLLDDVQLAPIEITKHNRPVGAVFSMQKLHMMADSLLSEPLKNAVAQGDISVIEAINEQLKMDEHIKTVLSDVEQGKYSVPDEQFWQRVRDKANLLNKPQ